MELTVNYSYVEQIIPPRCRKPRPQRFEDGVAVLSIREVTAEQAPVAIVGREKDHDSDNYLEPVVYRWFDGRLWTDCDVSNCSRRRASCYPALGPTLNLVKDSAVLSNPALGIYVCVHEGKQGIADHLQACAKDWLIIDGQLYRPAGEPMYVVMTFGLSGNHGGTALLTDDHLNPNIQREAYFSLLELDQAITHTLLVAGKRGDTVKVSTNPGFQFQVLIPAAIQWENPAAGADDTAEAA
ncbi:TPA: hypothetical protein SL557_000171 [Pseudomonas aeruginosa]|nr:hypothetical protein [Pseudomonas aeruginosa]